MIEAILKLLNIKIGDKLYHFRFNIKEKRKNIKNLELKYLTFILSLHNQLPNTLGNLCLS